MNIVCASSVLCAREAFVGLGTVRVVPDRDITSETLRDADALIVRSKTRVTPKLLADTPVTFVATATAGHDHFDTEWLEHGDIAWTAAPGCNANAVAEYTVTAIALLARRHAALLNEKTLGIIGAGQVGGRVAPKAKLLGLRVLLNDPPLALRTENNNDFLSLDSLLPRADIISLHIPLESAGPFPTHHLADCRFFGKLKPGAWFINTSRGEVTDTESLQFALEHHLLSACALDVWENEPHLPPALQNASDVLTPHIAGYTLEGLLNGTLHTYRELCHFLEVEPTWTPAPAPPPLITLSAEHRSDADVLTELLCTACPIPHDDHTWRAAMTTPDPAELRTRFDRYRKAYTARREFTATRIHLSHATPALLETITAFGFQVCTQLP